MPRNKKPKYKNYAELSAAFKNGELDKKHYYVMLDKGGSEVCLCYRNDKLTEEENDQKQAECSELFNFEYGEHIEDMLKALSIPAEWC